MAIISISRGSFSHGKEIAERVARQLDYACVSREILLEASRFFEVPEMKLARTIHDAPNLLERMTHGKEKYINYIQAALLEHARTDKLVYHGYAGHLLLPPSICHVLKVRIIANMEERIAYLQKSESKSREEAREYLVREDRERSRWARYLYDVDVRDSYLYDMVIHIGKLKIDDACDIIAAQAKRKSFTADGESLRALGDIAISSHIRAALQETCQAEVASKNGFVHIRVPSPSILKSSYASHDTEKHMEADIRRNLVQDVIRIAEKAPGVKDVVCDVDSPVYH